MNIWKFPSLLVAPWRSCITCQGCIFWSSRLVASSWNESRGSGVHKTCDSCHVFFFWPQNVVFILILTTTFCNAFPSKIVCKKLTIFLMYLCALVREHYRLYRKTNLKSNDFSMFFKNFLKSLKIVIFALFYTKTIKKRLFLPIPKILWFCIFKKHNLYSLSRARIHYIYYNIGAFWLVLPTKIKSTLIECFLFFIKL